MPLLMDYNWHWETGNGNPGFSDGLRRNNVPLFLGQLFGSKYGGQKLVKVQGRN